MPSFEKSSESKSTKSGLGAGLGTHIFSIYGKGDIRSNAGFARPQVYSVGIKSSEDFAAAVSYVPSGMYTQSAGGSLDNIFCCFESTVGVGSGWLPSFHDSVLPSGTFASGAAPTFVDLLPFRWKNNDSNYIYDIHQSPSGSVDSLSDLISGDKYYGPTSRYRDISSIRGVGLRLPMMGVGWGFTTDGDPWPSGAPRSTSQSGLAFRNGELEGYKLNQSLYVAAPIDLRYDRRKNVWTTERGFWAEITGSGINAQFPNKIAYSWREVTMDASGIMQLPSDARVGTFDKIAALHVNNAIVGSGNIVWLQTRERTNAYAFTHGGSGQSPDRIGQYQYMAHVMVTQNVDGFDWIRAHPDI
jgi:hypothetical protein